MDDLLQSAIEGAVAGAADSGLGPATSANGMVYCMSTRSGERYSSLINSPRRSWQSSMSEPVYSFGVMMLTRKKGSSIDPMYTV